jgi:hypothetical protein
LKYSTVKLCLFGEWTAIPIALTPLFYINNFIDIKPHFEYFRSETGRKLILKPQDQEVRRSFCPVRIIMNRLQQMGDLRYPQFHEQVAIRVKKVKKWFEKGGE